LLAALAGNGAAQAPAVPRFRLRYEYPSSRSSLALVDFKFISAQRAIAAGSIEEKGKEKGTLLVSSDGGATWSLEAFSQIPVSLFFLDDSLGWMVTDKGIWKTVESGRSWQKLNGAPKDLLRVHFLDATHGFAVGYRKQMYRTEDGGATWTAVPEAAAAEGTPETTTLGTIAFANAHDGLVTGWNTPGGERESAVPDWADPDEARYRRDVPTLTVMLETRNGGQTWKPQAASLFGRMTRTSLRGTKGLGLMEFSDKFEWPSEVYRVNLTNGHSERAYREHTRVITDVLLNADDTGYIAGYEAVSQVRRSPVPGPVKALVSHDLVNWEEVPVDYRAEAHRCYLSAADGEHVWLATDTGLLLSLEK
jgi:photosystem II stability/assembly factor-like uncharacterized protein